MNWSFFKREQSISEKNPSVAERAVDNVLSSYEPVMLFFDKQSFATLKKIADRRDITVGDLVMGIVKDGLVYEKD